MLQQSMIPTRLSEGGGSDPADSAPRKKTGWIRAAKNRQFLACVSATLTMLIVGTINGWTTTALFYQTSATREVPLKLGYDEYSWVVFLTVLCSMVGSLVGAKLADHSGRKYCLLVCSGMFTAGWILIYVENSIRILHLARVIHGIGIGIARTINPMYVSEIADISIRGIPGILIAVNVYIGSLLTCYIGYWVTYELLLVILIIISLISFLLNICFPDTPYFLEAKGQRRKARRSMAYYKDIIDPGKVKMELRELRAQSRYELHPESRYELHQQSRSDIPSQSRTDLHSQSSSDLPSQSRSNLPSQSRSNLPPQSMHEGFLGPIQLADTEPMSNLYLPSSSHSPPISATHSQVIYGVHQQRTRELLLQPSRALHSQSTTDLFRPTTPELFRPFTTELFRPFTTELFRPFTTELFRSPTRVLLRPSTSELLRPSTRELLRPFTSELLRSPTSELLRPSTREIYRPYTSQIHGPSTSQIHGPSTSQIHGPSTSQIHGPSTSQIHGPFTSQIHRPFTSEINRPSTSQIYRPSTSQIHGPSTSQIHGPSTSQIHGPSTSQIHGPSTSQIHGPSTSQIRGPSTSQIHGPSTSQIHGPSTSQIHGPSTSQIHGPSTSQIHGPSTSQIHGPSTSQIQGPSTSQIHGPSTSQIHGPSTSQIHGPSTSQIQGPSTSQIHGPSTSEMNPDLLCERQSRSRSDSRTQSNVDSGASADINEIHMDGPKYTCLTKLQVILQRSNRKALFIMLGLIMTQQLSGNFTSTQYLEMIFNKTMIASNSYKATILAQLVIVIPASLTIIIVNFVGRKTLLLASTIGSCITLCILAYYLWLDQYMSYTSMFDIIYMHILIIYQVMFQIGLGTIPKLLICELFPTEIKGYVGAIIAIFDGIITFAASKLYQMITDNGASYSIYLIFATLCCLASLMVYIWLPETKGKTYNEIKTFLVGTKTNSSNKCFRFHRRHVYKL